MTEERGRGQAGNRISVACCGLVRTGVGTKEQDKQFLRWGWRHDESAVPSQHSAA